MQTPQDYRDWEQAPYFRRLYYSYGYFFDVSQRSRNERNAAIFGGTMGLIRRSALADAGGWDEWCITEDAELSLRLLKQGGHGMHVDRSYGHGVMPLTFEALKRQRYRWCFGGIQILRMHWRSLLPGRRRPDNQLNPAQRWGYLVGGLQWFGDLAGLLFTGFLLVGAIDMVLGGGLVVRRLSGFLLLAVATLLILGLMRAVALVRRTSGASWSEALGAFGLWVGLGLSVARASARGLVARRGVFLRTPKVRGQLRLRHALIGNVGESLLAVVCVAAAVLAAFQTTVASTAIASLLLVQGLGYAAAPLNSVAAIRSDLPVELERRRRWALASWGGPARQGGLALGLVGVAAVVTLLAASPVGMPPITPAEELFTDVESQDDGGTPATPGTPPEPTGAVTPVGGGPASSIDASVPAAVEATDLPAAPGTLTSVAATPAPAPAAPGTPAAPPAATAPPAAPTPPDADPPTDPVQPSQAPTAPPTDGTRPGNVRTERP